MSGAGTEGSRAHLSEIVRRLNDDLAAIEVSAESDDGLISATVGVRGELRGLEIDPRVYRSPDSRALAAEIVRTTEVATRMADEAAARATREVFLLPDEYTGAGLGFAPLLHHLDGRPIVRTGTGSR